MYEKHTDVHIIYMCVCVCEKLSCNNTELFFYCHQGYIDFYIAFIKLESERAEIRMVRNENGLK